MLCHLCICVYMCVYIYIHISGIRLVVRVPISRHGRRHWKSIAVAASSISSVNSFGIGICVSIEIDTVKFVSASTWDYTTALEFELEVHIASGCRNQICIVLRNHYGILLNTYVGQYLADN